MLNHVSGSELEVELPKLRRKYGIDRRWHAAFTDRIPEILARNADDPEAWRICQEFARLDQLEMVTTLLKLQTKAYDNWGVWMRRMTAIADAATARFGGGYDWWPLVYRRLWYYAVFQSNAYDLTIHAINDALLDWGYC